MGQGGCVRDEPTVDEMRAELERELERQAKRGDAAGGAKWERILRDPKAYFTRPRDWEHGARQKGWDLSRIPKLNVAAEAPPKEEAKRR
jgi:hypothetical protein